MKHYVVAGLTVRSEIELPELTSREPSSARADVEIRCGAVPAELPGSVQANVQAQVTPEKVLVNVPDVARYLVQGGREILVDVMPGAEPKDARLFLLGSAFGAIYFQRGFFPLHASAIVMEGAGVAFAGDSGSGKSTMAAWMNAQGWPLLCDDVCVIRFNKAEEPIAYPGFPRLKLWSDTLEEFAIDSEGLQRDYFRADKFHLRAEKLFRTEPVPLRQVHILRFSEDGIPARRGDVKPVDAVSLLRDNTYRLEYISAMGLTERHFLDCVRLARTVKIRLLERSHSHESLTACQRLVEQSVS